MTKFSHKKNHLRDLVLTSSDKEYGRTTIQGILKSLLEPLMEQTSPEGLVLMKLSNTKGIESVIKRLEFSDVKIYSYCDNLVSNKIINIEKNKIWDSTEFVLILASRYSAVMIWDFELSNNDMTQVCLILNSREISDIANVLFDNSTIELNNYLTTYSPDRREQKTMNTAVNKIVDCLNNVNQEMVFTKAEQETFINSDKVFSEYEQISEKAKFIAHEIKNHVSVIDLYTQILEKRLENTVFEEETEKSIQNGIKSIRQSATSIFSFISELRSFSKPMLTEQNLVSLVNNIVELAKPRANNQNITIETELTDDYKVITDEIKIQNVILNIIYNAIEAIENNGTVTLKTGKTINNKIQLLIKDSGKGIKEENISKIFEEGFTTKTEGNGLGLCICKNLMKEQNGDIKLTKTGSEGTEFEILIPLA